MAFKQIIQFVFCVEGKISDLVNSENGGPSPTPKSCNSVLLRSPKITVMISGHVKERGVRNYNEDSGADPQAVSKDRDHG